MSSAGTAALFTITDTKLYVSIVTLKIEDNVKLSKLLIEGFKRLVYWNECKVILRDHAKNSNMREKLDASIQGVNKLFVLAHVHGDSVTMKTHIENIFFQGLK